MFIYEQNLFFRNTVKAGPIGGNKQVSKYKIDCRFNKNTIIQTIEILSKYKDKISFIEEGDYQKILNKHRNLIDKDTFIYFDPPYVNKAKDLYNFYFLKNDHLRLKNFIYSLNNNWLLSYDYEPQLNELYKSFSNLWFI